MRTVLIVIGLALVARVLMVLALGSAPDAPVVPASWESAQGPLFEVRVLKPPSARPLLGLLPDGAFGLPASELRFDHASPGAEVARVAADHLELRADGWELVIESDGEGHVGPGTQLVFTMELGGTERRLRCRPTGDASGFLHTRAGETRPGVGSGDSTDTLDGQFLFELAICEMAETGQVIEWPPAPLTISGSFQGLPTGGR